MQSTGLSVSHVRCVSLNIQRPLSRLELFKLLDPYEPDGRAANMELLGLRNRHCSFDSSTYLLGFQLGDSCDDVHSESARWGGRVERLLNAGEQLATLGQVLGHLN